MSRPATTISTLPVRAPKRLIASALLAALALLLGGCGGSDEGDGAAGRSAERSSTAGAAEQAATSASAPVEWPLFGRVPERTHHLPASTERLDPPLRQLWQLNTHALIEFPPAIHGGVAYVINKYGNGKAVRLSDRKVLWELRIRPSDKGKPNFVTAPVYHEGRIYGAFLDGHLAAGDAETGRRLWVRKLGAHLESSPLALDGTLYLGTDTTDVLALDAASGGTRWKANLPAAIKASPSHHDGRIFVADYESSLFALDAGTGRVIWRTNTSQVPPYGRGGFFSSPAVAFGRVYAARDDGTVFAFDERTGRVAWSFPTGDYVYGSPAVARVPGTPPTVYIGAENGRFFALDARTGRVRWRYDVGAPIPGTATVIGRTVYTSSFEKRETVGIDARTHRKVFSYDDAGYTPMVSDGRRLYLVGYYVLAALQPRR